MSNNRDRYSSSAVSRRSSPADPNNYSAALFQTGQGGITVLPPLSNIIPTPSRFPVPPGYTTSSYAQPRSANPKIGYDLSAQALYGNYPNTGTSPQFQNSFSYEIHDAGARAYSPQPSYNGYARSNTPIMTNPNDSRRLPPLSTTPSPPHRWQQTNFMPSTGNYPVNNIRSPTASYPNSYINYNTPNQANAYQYHVSHDHLSSLDAQGHGGMYEDVARLELRSSSPYGRSSATHMAPPPPQQRYTPPPVSPTSPEEPTIKKKRKRADAHQLKVLNDTYSRTAFPSTEERIRLAKDLDMSARSVQIWFQNKRQSMRQTNKQSSTVSSSSHHPFSSHQGDHINGLISDSNLGYPSAGLGDALYLSGPSQEAPRSISSHSHHYHHSPSSHRLSREEEDRKPWSRI